MNAKETKSQRLMLISKWKSNARKSLSRDRSKTPEIPPEPVKKSSRRNSKVRECLIPISSDSSDVDNKQQSLLVEKR